MTNEASMARLADLLDTVQAGMKSIEKMQQHRALLTGVRTAANNRVKVTVNADGAVIETRLTGDIHKLAYDRIGDAVTSAAQDAIAEMRRKTTELIRPLQKRKPLVPKLSELVPGAPDVFDLFGGTPGCTEGHSEQARVGHLRRSDRRPSLRYAVPEISITVVE
ncbi:YbaB/EbfC family nucleoid-associated protein [Nocardia sp. NBC_00881]|uniref:YbaB/EbfC family nucleoid-associated protein n=1 Tax=Nocardia sp. NBC_00881 TaxID=2975995 RepID=UPI00386F60D5|nr:YbaB/EbfC family nucleoid-associated protein [Nocardia sp. NBC_00881]